MIRLQEVRQPFVYGAWVPSHALLQPQIDHHSTYPCYTDIIDQKSVYDCLHRTPPNKTLDITRCSYAPCNASLLMQVPRLPTRGAHYVHPRSRNSTINIGIGIPSSQSNTHPTAPRSFLRITILHCIQVSVLLPTWGWELTFVAGNTHCLLPKGQIPCQALKLLYCPTGTPA